MTIILMIFFSYFGLIFYKIFVRIFHFQITLRKFL